MKGLLRSCLLGYQDDVLEVRRKFKDILLEIFGPPQFREFVWKASNHPATK